MDQEKQSSLLSSYWIFLQFAIKISLKSKERSKFLQNNSVARMLASHQQSSFTLDIHPSNRSQNVPYQATNNGTTVLVLAGTVFFDLLDLALLF